MAQHCGPVAVERRVVVDELGADDVAAGDGVAEERGRGERLVVGERLLGQTSPDGGVVDEHAAQRVAERPGSRAQDVASASASTLVVVEQLELGLVGLGPVLLGEDAHDPVAVHLEHHADASTATSEAGEPSAPGSVEVTQHPSHVIAPFTPPLFGGYARMARCPT